MNTVHAKAKMRAAVRALPRPLGFVPTMGALHEGHLALVRQARRECASLAASIFVNPTQFGPGEDYERYPRHVDRDVRLLSDEAVDAAFVPDASEMYAADAGTVVMVEGALTSSLEGAARPGHFDGVATVVTKLLNVVRPDRLYLGQKDAQQLAVVRRLVRDLDLPVEVVAVDTVREPDGLAMSSRNVYLSAAERSVAPRLHASLLASAAAARGGASAADAHAAALAALRGGRHDAATGRPQLLVEYVAIVDPDSFEAVEVPKPGHLVVGAARLGSIRLIDNVRL